MGRNWPKILCALLLWQGAGGCQTGRLPAEDEPIVASSNLSADNALTQSDAQPDTADTPLGEPFANAELESVVIPPAGWTADPVKRSRNHAHQAWLSPSRNTAYGVIRMSLPMPFIGPDVVLPRFLEQMRETEGEAELLSRRNDSRLPGIRFVAEGGQYRLRANLVTRGFRAWAVYAGTLRSAPEQPDELHLAEAAREETRVGTTRVRSRSR